MLAGLDALAAAAKYILVMLVGFAAARVGLRAPPLLLTIATGALVAIVAWSVAPAFTRAPLEVLRVSLLYAASSSIGAVLVSLPLERNDVERATRRDVDKRFTLIVALAMLLGFVSGSSGLPAPASLVDPLLTILVFLAGLELGRHPVRVEARALLTPLASITGSLLGALPVYLATRVTLAVAAGMGWYTFTGPYLLAATGDARVAAVGFLANLVREQTAILLVPLAARKLPLPAAVAIGGVTTMDTTLPVYTTAYGPRGTMLAAANGAILTLLVPILVPLVYAAAP